jgi:diguanylate cyclase (GGDEF)-like protein
MKFLDVPTVLQISALFNLMAALAWLTLAQVFRIAPRASRLMAAAHLVRVLLQGCEDCMAGWPLLLRQGVAEFSLLLCMLLLLLALRRMMGSRRRARHIAWISGVGALGIALALASGSSLLPQLASMGSATVLAALAVHEIRYGTAHRLSPFISGCTALPFALLTVAGLVHIGMLLTGVGPASRPGELPTAPRAVVAFIVTAGITLSLIALMIWRVIMRIQHLTFRDPLTGALNRRAFEQALDAAQAQLQRGHGYALAMIDIDHFKRINDDHGHLAGDAALQHCVRIWQAELREVDRLGRLGGEEFCALLPLTSPADLATPAAVTERLRAALEAQPLQWQGQVLPLTASFGVALPVTDDPKGEVGMARADGELYRAKVEGRNRVCVATHLQPAGAA